jgi:hypothetical protein
MPPKTRSIPPGYEQSPGTLYPVVYWLHGIGGNQTGVPRFCERVTQAIFLFATPATQR